MKVEKHLTIEGINYRYTLSNEGLKVGDKVFCIISGRYDGEMFFHSIDLPDNFNNFHIITGIGPNYIFTDKGYSHKLRYFKIIKIEEQKKDASKKFASYTWEEIKEL